MKNKLIKQILEFCKEMEEDKLVKLGDTMSVRFEDGMLITSPLKPMTEIGEDDIIYVAKKEPKDELTALHLAIYGAREDINAIIINHAPYCVGIAKGLKKFPACLDDMAQIIGPTAKVAPSGKAVDVIKTLSGRNACLIKNDGVIATGRTLDEAHTGSLVLEKGAIAYVGSTVLGNSVKISTFDALLMRFIYKTKYSKKDQAEKQAELKA
ncbi:MAG: class II aldolase/adducin family protein [Clostridia bacterium]|nr:class II aldolase/adducin family protein [Clostridia bacterium]